MLKNMTNIDWTKMPNPKRSPRDVAGRHAWYPFYPGFSNEFASWMLDVLAAEPGSLLLDPWNGSGTTTALAAQRGLPAIGFDLNPAMVVIARAKLLDPLEVDSIRPLSRQILKVANGRKKLDVQDDDPLRPMFAHEGAPAIRAIERSIRQLLVDSPVTPESGFNSDAGKMSPLAAFFYVALFRASRNLLRPLAGTNPVWTKLNVAGQARPRPSVSRVRKIFAAEVEAMLACETDGRPLVHANAPAVIVKVASSTELTAPSASVNLTLTSPPYCTRVDYAVAMLPELAILGLQRGSSFDELRRKLTGTTTVPKKCDPIDPAWGATCSRFLQSVENHKSKASAGYYLKSHARYFSDLSKSIAELKRVTVPGGKAVLVVQDSYYKELHNDLPKIVVEMAEQSGFAHVASRHFPLKRLIAASNPRVRKYRAHAVTATESVVVIEV